MPSRRELYRVDVIKSWISVKPSRRVIDEWIRIKVNPEKLKILTLKPRA